MAASAYVTRAEAKAYLGLETGNTAYDDLIDDWILVVSEAIDAWTESRFDGPIVVTGEIKEARRQDIIIPKRWPMLSVQQIVLNVLADGTGGSVLPATEYNFDEVEIRLRWLTLPFQRGYLRLDYTWGYAAVPARVKLATKLGVEGYFRMKKSQSVGIKIRSKEGESISFDGAWNQQAGLPGPAVSLLSDFRRIDFDLGDATIATRNM